MDPTRRLALATAASAGQSRLVLDGRDAGADIAGREIAAQFELDDGAVLAFITDADVYDCGLAIVLLERHGALVDLIVNGGLAADLAGQNEAALRIEATAGVEARFRFYPNGRRYLLRVAARPVVMLPWSLPAGFAYGRVFARHRLGLKEMVV